MNPVGPQSADEQLRAAIRRLPASDGPPAALDARIRERARAAVAPARRRRLPPLWLSAAASVFVAFFAINLLRQSGQAPSLEQQLAPAQRAPVAVPDTAADAAAAGAASDAHDSGADGRSMAEPTPGVPLPEQRVSQTAEPDDGDAPQRRQLQPAVEHETASTRKRELGQPQSAPATSRLTEERQLADDAASVAAAEPAEPEEAAPAGRPQAFPADAGRSGESARAGIATSAPPASAAPAPAAPPVPPPPAIVAEPRSMPAQDPAKPAAPSGPAPLGASAAKAETARSAAVTGARDEASAASMVATESKEDAGASAERVQPRHNEALSQQPALRRQPVDDQPLQDSRLRCLADQAQPCLAQVRRWLAEGRREEAAALLHDTLERFPQAVPADLQSLLH